jgi:hypothetical protein
MIFAGGIAQLVEHLVRNQGVEGSSPFTSTKQLKKRRTSPVFFFEQANHIFCERAFSARVSLGVAHAVDFGIMVSLYE